MRAQLAKYLTTIPQPLQRHILKRSLMGCAFLIFTVLLLLLRLPLVILMPGILFALYLFGSSIRLLDLVLNNNYVILEGVCTKCFPCSFFKKTQTLLLETDGHILQLQLRTKPKHSPEGKHLQLYLSDHTQMFEKDGILLIYDYILLHEISPAAPVH